MKSYALSLVLVAGLAGLPLLAGCEREVMHSEQQHTNPDGTVTKDQKTVTTDDQGHTTTSVDHHTNP